MTEKELKLNKEQLKTINRFYNIDDQIGTLNRSLKALKEERKMLVPIISNFMKENELQEFRTVGDNNGIKMTVRIPKKKLTKKVIETKLETEIPDPNKIKDIVEDLYKPDEDKEPIVVISRLGRSQF